MRTHTLLVVSALALVACGGDEKTPKTADSVPTPTETASAEPKPDMPPAADPPAPPPAVNVVAFKFVPNKGGKWKAFELSQDGALTIDGKPAGKITADGVQDADGVAIYTVAQDGAVTGPSVNKPIKFNASDELEGEDGMKISIDDEGTPVIVMKAKGKPEKGPGKFENLDPKGKRAAVLAVAMLVNKVSSKGGKKM